jgi:hypothetical protein
MILVVFSAPCSAQTLPYKDKGFAISYNYSQRHIPDYSYAQKPVQAPGADFKIHRNFKNKLSLKYGISIFVTGHRSDIYYINYYTPDGRSEEAQTIYGYIRLPICLSYNFKRFYFDVGAAPCVRVFQSINVYGKGNEATPRFTYTLEGHFGYYIPVKHRRMFIEGAVCFSEIGNRIFATDGTWNYTLKNNYTQNLQLSIGFMLNKSEN